MIITSTIAETRNVCAGFHGSLGFVPTMGSLHAGHSALVRAAKLQCDYVAVSIFVNPKQFGANEDLSRYPRSLDRDIALLEDAGVDVLFTPTDDELYPQGYATTVSVEGLGNVLCGAHRAGHFTGVTTVVSVLLSIFRPAKAFFGEKDYQQLAIISRLNADLRLAGEVVGVPTLRADDGLALSSRNQYLSVEQRAIAPLLYHVLCDVRGEVIRGQQPVDIAMEKGKERLLAAGFNSIDYLEMCDASTLAFTHSSLNAPINARLFVAARLGATRLIDNISIKQ